MERSKHSLRAILFLSGLAGCNSMPQFDAPVDDTRRPTVSTIIDEIACEMADARDNNSTANPELKDFKSFRQWTAAVTLTLTVDDTVGTATAGTPISFINNISKTGTFAFGLTPTLYQLRARTYTQNYTVNIAAIPPYDECVKNLKVSSGFNLTGDLGLKDQIYMGLHSFTKTQNGAAFFATKAGTKNHPATIASAGDTFGATVSFNVYYGVNNVGPNWTLSTFKGPTAGVGYVRNDLHQVVISFEPTIAPSAALPPSDAVSLKTLADKIAELQKEIEKLTPGKATRDAVLDGPRPPAPSGPVPEQTSEKFKPYNEAQAKVDNYDAKQRLYSDDLLNVAQQTVAYSAKVREYETTVSQYNAILASRNQSISVVNAGDAARSANQAAVTVQAINALGQTLNRP